MHLKNIDNKWYIVDDGDNFWCGYGYGPFEEAISYKTNEIARKELSEIMFIGNKIRKNPAIDFKGEFEVAVYGLEKINISSLQKFLQKSINYYVNGKFHDDAQIDIRLNFNTLEVI